MGVAYCTREEVKASLEIAHTSRSDVLIDRYIQSSSRSIEGRMHRRFYPEIKTVYKDWPNYQYAPTWRLYLDQHDLISVASLTVAGNVISPSDYLLRPDDGPPFTYIEMNLSSSASFGGGTTHQRSIAIAGNPFGYTDETALAGKLSAGVNSSVTVIPIKPVNNILKVGVGSLIKIGSERMIVVGRNMADTTQNLQTSLTASKDNTTVAVSDGTTFATNEIILIDSERMRIVDIASNNLIVERAFDGTNLKLHTAPTADIYALRSYIVTRAALGTTAASHSTDDDVLAQLPPSLINELAVAESVVLLEQSTSGYARLVGAGSNLRESSDRGLVDLREQAWIAHGRKSRKRAI